MPDQFETCPACAKPLLSDAVVCIQCGFDKRKGRRLVTVKSVGRALRLPRVSGVHSFLTLLLCMGITALLVPMALKLPAWIEAEIVIAAWWGIWCVALTLFLYNGWLVTHDFHKPTFSKHATRTDGKSGGAWDGMWWMSFPDFGGGEADAVVGCFALIILIILLPFIIVFLAEAAVFLAFVMYLLIRAMLVNVAHSHINCGGRLARAVGLGVFWATIYTAPLGGIVWLAHRMHA